MLQTTENSELVRRRGRWMSSRVMDIYLQEVVATTFLPSLVPELRAALEALAANFAVYLQWAVYLDACRIPRRAWYYLLSAETDSFRVDVVG